MVAKIRLELEDATESGLKSFEKGLDKASKSLDDLKSSMDEAKAESLLLASGFSEAEVAAMELEEKLANARHELDVFGDSGDGLGDIASKFDELKNRLGEVEAAENAAAAASGKNASSIDHMGDEAGQTSDQLHRMNSALGGSNASAGSFVETMAKLWAFKETFMKVAQGVTYLAEQGNPAAKSITASFKELQATLVELSESEQWQYMFTGISGGIDLMNDGLQSAASGTEKLAEGQIKYNVTLQDTQTTFNILFASWSKMLGLIDEGTRDQMHNLIDEREAAAESHAERIANLKADAEMRKSVDTVEKARREMERGRELEAYAERTSKIENLGEIEALLQKEIETTRQLSLAGKVNAEQAQDYTRRLAVLESRRKEVEKRDRDERIDQQKESKRIEEEMRKQDLDLFMKEQEAKEQKAQELRDSLKQKRYDDQQKEIEQAREHAEKLRQAYQSEVDKGQAPALDLEKLGGGVSSAARVRRFYVDQKTDAAGDVVEEKYRRANVMSADGGFINNETERYVKREIQKARDQARREAARDVRSGKADEDLYRIQGDFAEGYLNEQRSNGSLSKQTLEAMRATVKETIRRKQENETLMQEVQQIKQTLDSMESMGERRMAQRRT